KFLADIALRPGTEVRVLQRDRVVGLLTVAVDGAERVVSFQLANAILTQGVPQTAPRKERANVTPISTARGAV
ncbi:MAG: FeoA domain-containing protein, partial [Candidatus Eremiobacteraeota bacterium]|nr:FeoA domain-containing protein [Candidatus Eremiobacteraeota bacterium]